VDVRLVEALAAALRAREVTGGRFDPTILPALAAAGYDRSFEQLEPRPARTVAGWSAGAHVEVDPAAGRARVEEGAAVDLGGIGKGFSATRALAAMRDAWPTLLGGLVDLGGDIALRGETPEHGPWRIAVADPRRPGATAGVLLLDNGGVATSGRDIRRFGPGGALHHLIDPSTGLPAAPGPLAITVVARDAVEAESHATALAMADAATAVDYVAAREHLSALYVPHDGAPVALGQPPLVQARLLLRAA
jgi:FAD:protein FMN transferase